MHGGTIWNSAEEPFQSYDHVSALRNEIVHFKGQFCGKDETPNGKIAGLMTCLGIASQASFADGDVSSWSHDLLKSPKLGPWVAQKVRPFYDNAFSLLLGKP